MASKFFCPIAPHDCEYDGAVNFMRQLFGHDYINGILGVSTDVAHSGAPITSTIIGFLSAIVLFILLVILTYMGFSKIIKIGQTGEVSSDNEDGFWPYFRPLLAVLLVAPIGVYPVVITFTVIIALLGNGLANMVYNKLPEHYMQGASLSSVFKDTSNKVKSVEEAALVQSNTLQKYAFYGALHGTCIGKLKNLGYAAVPVVELNNEQGRISITYYNRESLKEKKFWGLFGSTVLASDSGKVFGVSSEGVCGRVEFDFFNTAEYNNKYGDFVKGHSGNSSSRIFADFGGGSGSRADQSVRTKEIQESVNELVSASSLIGAQINNLRTSYALRTYLSALVHSGGMHGSKQCKDISSQITPIVGKVFEGKDFKYNRYAVTRDDKNGSSIKGVIESLHPYTSPETLVRGEGRYPTGVSSDGNSNQTASNMVLRKSGASICEAPRSTGQAWPTNLVQADVNGNGGQLEFFDANSIFAIANLMESNLFTEQKALFVEQGISERLKGAEERIKKKFGEYLVGRGWIYAPEASVVMRNIEHGLKGTFYSGSGAINIFSPMLAEGTDVSVYEYNHFIQEVSKYNSKAFAVFSNSGNAINPTLATELKVANAGSSSNMMGNVLDSAVDVGPIRGLQASIINSISGDKLTSDPIGGLVEIGNAAVLAAVAVDALQQGLAGAAILGATMSLAGGVAGGAPGAAAGGAGGLALGVGAMILDTITGMVTPTLQELEDALDGVGQFLSVVVPSFPSLMLVVAAVAWAMQVVISAIGIMMWLILMAMPNTTFVGNIQQLWITLIALLFRPILIFSGYLLASLMASVVILYLFESWFVTKGLMSMEADNAITQLVIEVKLFKADFWRLAIMIAIVFYFVYSWIQELSDEVFNFLGTNFLPTFGNVASHVVAGQFGGGMKGMGAANRGYSRNRLAAKQKLADDIRNSNKDPKDPNEPDGGGSGGGGSSVQPTSGPSGAGNPHAAPPSAKANQAKTLDKTAKFTRAGSGLATGNAPKTSLNGKTVAASGNVSSNATKATGDVVGTKTTGGFKSAAKKFGTNAAKVGVAAYAVATGNATAYVKGQFGGNFGRNTGQTSPESTPEVGNPGNSDAGSDSGSDGGGSGG